MSTYKKVDNKLYIAVEEGDIVKCYCELQAHEGVVTGESVNKGKTFYCCAHGMGENKKCKYFQTLDTYIEHGQHVGVVTKAGRDWIFNKPMNEKDLEAHRADQAKRDAEFRGKSSGKTTETNNNVSLIGSLDQDLFRQYRDLVDESNSGEKRFESELEYVNHALLEASRELQSELKYKRRKDAN